jgi:Protein of unknown function (DUF429)
MLVPNKLIGVDFTSTPSKRKSITVAFGHLQADQVVLERLQAFTDWPSFTQLLMRPEPWLGGFDFPFGLPRELVVALNWPTTWAKLIEHVQTLERSQLREQFKQFCAARPVGNKFAHRATDIPAGSSPSMKWVNPPVAYMFHEGAPRLLQAGVLIPGLHKGTPSSGSIAFEAYPGFIARSITKASYKSDDKNKQTAARESERVNIVKALRLGEHVLQLPVQLTKEQSNLLIQDPGADWLDATICLVQAAWAAKQAADHPQLSRHLPKRYGLPLDLDSLEGWIVGV